MQLHHWFWAAFAASFTLSWWMDFRKEQRMKEWNDLKQAAADVATAATNLAQRAQAATANVIDPAEAAAVTASLKSAKDQMDGILPAPASEPEPTAPTE